MSGYSEDDVRRAAELREWLMKQISDKQEELERLRSMITIIDNVLKLGSFRAAATMTASTPSSTSSPASPSTAARVPARQQQQPSSPTPQQQAASPHSSSSPKQQQANLDTGRDIRPLKRAKDDFILANVEITSDAIAIVPVQGVSLNVNTPPFRSFFLGRILDGMKAKDAERVTQGSLSESSTMSYRVEEDAGSIRRIVITNYREKDRLTEILNTSAWVFTRMLEKANG